ALTDPLHHRFQRRFGLIRVAAVDEGHVGEPGELGEHGYSSHFLLPDAGEVAADQLYRDPAVEEALVVEDKHRRPGGPKIVLAGHVHPHAGEGQADVTAEREGEVGRVAAALV